MTSVCAVLLLLMPLVSGQLNYINDIPSRASVSITFSCLVWYSTLLDCLSDLVVVFVHNSLLLYDYRIIDELIQRVLLTDSMLTAVNV